MNTKKIEDKPIGGWITGYYHPDGEYWKCKQCGEQIIFRR